ncbi:MAG: UDP-glucose 4-epimerase GalE [Actinomycetota bacterium]|nr:UDP-glucose 4-epimerase GalE [Actinomycetota bacterium]MDP2289254.1 UDP-glucose 4-epimerase GalE [Actinomycetota bacterium]
MTTWLVTGGAGYIGNHVTRALLASGRDVVVVDDLSTGNAARIPDAAVFVQASVADRDALTNVLTEHQVDGVIHLAAKKAPAASIDTPLHYYRENVGGIITLLEAMADAGVRRIVHSSSAAVYGTPVSNPTAESAQIKPESPYGETKVVSEWVVKAEGIATGLSWIALRYFNVAGAGSDELGDTSINNLIPMVFDALERGRAPQIFGDDYPTPDGTAIRDYIHVVDLADAHVAAAAHLEHQQEAQALNVGRGVGASVREVMDVISDVIGTDVHPVVVSRRPGDPEDSTAATARIHEVLGWQAQYDLTAMVASAWSAWGAQHGR